MKNTTKARKTREAKKSFATWNENRTPITDEQGNTIVVPEDEIFVPLYDYLEKKLRPKYYISNKSRVISFAKANNPQQRNINDSDEYDTIEIYSDKKKRKISFKLHRAVWFSFAYEYLTNGNTELKELAILSFGVDFSKANFKKLLNGDIYEVHHINVNEKDNRLENLLLLHEEVHNILTQMSRKNNSGRYEYFIQNVDKFKNKGKMIAVEVEEDKITGGVKGITISNQLRKNIEYQIIRMNWQPSDEIFVDIVNKVIEIRGKDYFKAKRYIQFIYSLGSPRQYSIVENIKVYVKEIELGNLRVTDIDIVYNYDKKELHILR